MHITHSSLLNSFFYFVLRSLRKLSTPAPPGVVLEGGAAVAFAFFGHSRLDVCSKIIWSVLSRETGKETRGAPIQFLFLNVVESLSMLGNVYSTHTRARTQAAR